MARSWQNATGTSQVEARRQTISLVYGSKMIEVWLWQFDVIQLVSTFFEVQTIVSCHKGTKWWWRENAVPATPWRGLELQIPAMEWRMDSRGWWSWQDAGKGLKGEIKGKGKDKGGKASCSLHSRISPSCFSPEVHVIFECDLIDFSHAAGLSIFLLWCAHTHTLTYAYICLHMLVDIHTDEWKRRTWSRTSLRLPLSDSPSLPDQPDQHLGLALLL